MIATWHKLIQGVESISECPKVTSELLFSSFCLFEVELLYVIL
jgi:hypothetical protein